MSSAPTRTWAWEVVGTGYEFGHNDDYDRTIKEMGQCDPAVR